MKKFCSLVVFVFVFLFTQCSVFAENFYINNYDVDMKVGTDKTVNITENIDVFFTNSSHGIFRNIPLSNGEITNVNVSETYSTSRNGSDYIIKIGSPNSFVSGSHHYTISYVHKLFDKPDEFYYNIIGTGWTVPINHVSFSVEMPKLGFNPQSLGISIGRQGTVGFKDRAVYSVDGVRIFGETREKLQPNEGITLRVPLPNGYFNIPVDWKLYTVGFIMILLTFFCWLIWFIVGRDEHVIPVVNFYPPDGYTSAEAEVLYKGAASEKGLVSLIVWLANKGYIKIVEQGVSYSIEKIKDYDGDNENVNAFLTSLIPNGSTVSRASLESSHVFYKECEEIIKNINKTKDLIFYKDSISWGFKLPMLLCLLSLVVLEALLAVNFNIVFLIGNFPLLLFPIIACCIFITSFKRSPIFITLWALGFGGIPLAILLSSVVFSATASPILFLGILCIIVSGICFYQLPKRNAIGNKELGRLLGFKKFLETVELPRVKMLVDENPNYCFDVLPYLYIFDLSDKWISKFETFFKEPPDWYSGNNFHRGYNNFTRNVSLATQPSVANGGISSSSSSGGGGGFSGGGCGGGGGGSW